MDTETSPKSAVKNINKPLYFILLIGGIFFLVRKDVGQAMIFWGLALAFDPFNIETTFKKRPAYQQLWLIIHLSITLALIVLTLAGK